ncbi:MAG: glycosyltransferase [Chloroflexota bacterium]|nr:MAG: hypothetical protein DLM70_10460 [Chloroflexota bacterium]
MQFTGERYVPELSEAQLSYEHWHRYLYASGFANGKAVLDLGCGEGYGAYLLALHASSVVAVDLSDGTIQHASSRYTRGNLRFETASVVKLPPAWAQSFDVIVMFETIEHINESEQQSLLREVKRVLRPGGVFIVSTPNKLTYTDLPQHSNPFHAKELYLKDFQSLLGSQFGHVKILGQKVQPVSYLWDLSAQPSHLDEYRLALSQAGFRPSDEPVPFVYMVAVCSDVEVVPPSASILVDISDQLDKERDAAIEHLNTRVMDLDKCMAEKDRDAEVTAGHVRELAQELARKDQALEAARAHTEALTGRLAARDQEVREATERVDRLNKSAHSLTAQVVHEERLRGEALDSVAELTTQLELDQQTLRDFAEGLAGWEAHWRGVQNSLAWKAVMPIRRVRRLFAPEGTWRERVYFACRLLVVKTRPKSEANGSPSVDTVSEESADTVQTAADSPAASPTGPETLEAASRMKLRTFLDGGYRLAFPPVEQPAVSIVMPLFNQAHCTLLALENLLEVGTLIPFEVILVDNGSTDETPLLLSRLDNVRIHVHETNLGFGEACNRGASLSRGQHICFLNSDALPNSGFLGEMLRVFARFPEVGAVGGKLVLPSGSVQEAGSIVWEDGSCLGYGRGEDPLAPEFAYVREVDFCSGACLLVRADAFRAVGGFDPRYSPAYYEDVDLCMALREKGYRTLYTPWVVARHLEHASSDRDTARALQLRNQSRFAEKWGRCLDGRGMPGHTQILLRRDSRPGLRLLIVDDRVPEQRIGSGFPRTRALVDALIASGYVITYLPSASPTPYQPPTDELQELGVEVLWGSRDVVAAVRDRASVCDAVIVSRPHNAHLLTVARDANPSVALVYDAEALFALRETRRAEIQGQPLSAAEAEERLRAEAQLVAAAELVLTVSTLEARAFQRYQPHVRPKIWGHAVPVRLSETPFEARQDLLFVGYLESEPNADAVLHFLRSISPLIRQEIPCRLLLAGAGASTELQEAAECFQGAVELLDFVDDLDPVFDRSRVFVAPHRFAAGIPLKVVEAMSHGLPCVISPLLSEELDVGDGPVLIGGDPQDFARQVLRLYTDGALWNDTRQQALRLVGERYDPERMRLNLSEWIEEVVAAKQHEAQSLPVSPRSFS